MAYEKIKRVNQPKGGRKTNKPFEAFVYYVNGCRVDLMNGEGTYLVKFIDSSSNKLLFSTNVEGHKGFATCNFEYFINWKVEILKDDKVVKTINLDLKDKRVFINIESKSLGDTLAWFPYVEEFRKKHNCKVVCSTFNNGLFKKNYPDIEFVEPGRLVQNIVAQYRIGWFYDEDGKISRFKNPLNPRSQPMQKTASDILGLPFSEIRPILDLPEVDKTDSVTLAYHSTCQAKYWNNPEGWADIVNAIKNKNFIPLMLSNEGAEFMGNQTPDNVIYLEDYSIENTIKELCKSKLFIGISTGLAWLAWACNIPVVLISGFSEDYTEFTDCYRVSAKNVCSGCFNKHRLNAGDWNWCPVHKGTSRQFECSSSISSKPIVNLINQLI